jgi:hypothetical protein
MSQRFDEVVHTMIDAHTTSVEAHRRIAEYARSRLQDLIRSGEGSPDYTRIVDGVIGAPEEAVKLDGGTIEYRFARITEAVVFALSMAREISPDPGGEYSLSWFVAVDGVPWTGSLTDIPVSSTVIIVNNADYARMLEQRGMISKRTARRRGQRARGILKRTPHPNHVVTELVRRETARRFPTISVERQFVTLPGAYVRKTPPRGAITYPAVVLTPKKA